MLMIRDDVGRMGQMPNHAPRLGGATSWWRIWRASVPACATANVPAGPRASQPMCLCASGASPIICHLSGTWRGGWWLGLQALVLHVELEQEQANDGPTSS